MGKTTNDRAYYLFGLRIIGDFGVTIAVPVVTFALLGKWLDAKWGTKPTFLIAGFILAALLSGASIYRKAKAYGKEYQRLNRSLDGVYPVPRHGTRDDKPSL